eukprot:m.28771 g.28771  ORF g.28771 m.28771 type:complete len:66 (-) comp9505_c0_seq1:3-200(-)
MSILHCQHKYRLATLQFTNIQNKKIMQVVFDLKCNNSKLSVVVISYRNKFSISPYLQHSHLHHWI